MKIHKYCRLRHHTVFSCWTVNTALISLSFPYFFHLRPAGTHPCHPLWLRRCRSRIEMRWTGTQLYTRLEKWLDRLDGVVLRTRHANAEVNWIKLKLMDWRVSRAVATSRERSANRVPDHQATPKKQVCLSCLLTSRNVRWPRRIVNHGEYADGTDRRTDVRPLPCAFRKTRPA